ncbi:MAG TPA: O-antigen ligase family protein [Chryseosolibacter sp.]|nr:O-antigen ligase family protein [Chryseosolibacter sp.]
MYLGKIKSWYPTVGLFVVLLAVSLGVTYVMSHSGAIIGPVILMIIFGTAVVGVVVRDFRMGFYLLLLMGVFMFYVERLFRTGFPYGTVYDALAGLTFLAVFINGYHKRDWTGFKHPITIAFVIVTLYQVMQVVNPAAVSQVAWLVAMRNNSSILLFIVCFHMFTTVQDIKRFTVFWLSICFIVAAYGAYQEWFGLLGFEERWITENPERLALYFIWGKMRKFSFLSDPSAYGLFTGMGALACLVLALGPFKTSLRIVLVSCGIFILMAMLYSGTRTATAMVAAGIVFYILVTLKSRRTMIATLAAGFIGGIVFFGPFYSGTVNRLRSTFSPSEDPSMIVRDIKRQRFQRYVQRHPIGGGLYTTGTNGTRYSRGHELATGIDPDSGYLMLGLELGYIGLFMFQVFFFIVMVKGINNYFSITDPLLQTFNLAYLVPFFALSVAHFTQDAIFTKPMNLIGIAAYAIIVKIQSFERKLYSVDLL